ncbi:hypothetical protein HHK36_031238 [Tetracentron sinense]|uniref:Ribosome-binding factor A n=1 Tax=Tetracentron sinense TaxID=13715 RepID=A0A834YDK8_TETSI|nr:hypothetical protein HHK36_031238 [Tetracentron sinense]
MPHHLHLHQSPIPPPFLPRQHFHLCSSFSITGRTMAAKAFDVLSAPPKARIWCMANPRRVKMVAKQIRRELSDMLLTDNVLQHAVLPEAALGADRYLSSLTTISDVEVSSDLQVVKVYVSVFGDERGREVAIAGLKGKAKYVRGELGRRMKLRLTPEIRFIEDESLERGSRGELDEADFSIWSIKILDNRKTQVIEILDRIKNEKKNAEGQDEGQSESSDIPQDERDWDVDDPDEGIIYIK